MATTKKAVKPKKKVKKTSKPKKAVKRVASKAKKKPAVRKGKKVIRAAKAKRSASRKPAKKAVSKKAVSKKAGSKKSATPKAIGRVAHFYGGIKVAIVRFSKPMKQGTEVRFRGSTTDFSQKLDSMQYDHKAVATAPKGKQIGVKVKSRVREGDQVYL